MCWRVVRSGGLAGALLLVLVMPSFAGGWAVTSFDTLPPQFVAGQTYRLGYTIRQHGVSPFSGAQTRIVITSTAGEIETFSFDGVADGAAGHYVADVRFPASGTWTWQVDQNPFATQPLGSLTVQTGADSQPLAGVADVPRSESSILPFADRGFVRVALPVATAAAGVLFVWRLVVLVAVAHPRRGLRTSDAAVLRG
jgi:hypothetical protein